MDIQLYEHLIDLIVFLKYNIMLKNYIIAILLF